MRGESCEEMLLLSCYCFFEDQCIDLLALNSRGLTRFLTSYDHLFPEKPVAVVQLEEQLAADQVGRLVAPAAVADIAVEKRTVAVAGPVVEQPVVPVAGPEPLQPGCRYQESNLHRSVQQVRLVRLVLYKSMYGVLERH